MEIKTSLKQLFEGFKRSADDESLPEAIRKFASRCIVLTAHVDRVEAQALARQRSLAKTVDEQVAELAAHLLATREGAPAGQAQPNVQQPPVEQQDGGMDEDEEAKAMAERVLAETQAEVAIAAKNAVTPIRPAAVAKPAADAS